jgi:arylsulfatase/uncharacterized sulfatase
VAARGAIHTGLTHVTDIVPTLLELAGVAHPGQRWQGAPVEPLAGRSLVPVLADPALRVRGAEEALGYELAGNKALFKGDLKLVLNRPPIGDGQWRLYDLSVDPGETRDLRDQLPGPFAAMQADHAAWAQANRVLAMPEGFDPMRQVLINTFVNYWIPQYWPHAAVAAVAAVALLAAGWLAWRRRRHRALGLKQRPGQGRPG